MKNKRILVKKVFIIFILAVIYDTFFNFYGIWGVWETEDTVYAFLSLTVNIVLIWVFGKWIKKHS
jgi:hypothetical protein